MLSKNANGVASAATGVLSLSANWQASPMWAHYAADHDGVCIGFDTSSSFFKPQHDNLIFKVEYRDERPEVPVSKFFESGLIDALYETKDDRWRYEEEFRIVRPLQKAGIILGKDKRGFPIHLFNIPTACVSEITVGLHGSDGLCERVKTWKATNAHTKVYKAVVGKRGYSMERHPLI